jgi:hypothetical protein
MLSAPMTTLVIGLWASAGASLPQESTARIVRVFVQTDDAGEPSELAARQVSARDLAAALASKKKTLRVVEDEDSADIVIDVVDRALTIPKLVLGLGARPGEPGAIGPTKAVVLRVRLTASTGLGTDFTNKNKAADNPRGWKSAAEDIADQIDKWVLRVRVVR